MEGGPGRDGGVKRILRRAYEWQNRFAWKRVESVANTTAFVSPAAFDLLRLSYGRNPTQFREHADIPGLEH